MYINEYRNIENYRLIIKNIINGLHYNNKCY